MKYSDDELAEAAVLLASTKESAGLGGALEKSLIAEGSRLAADMRHSTTRGAAMELGESLMDRAASTTRTRPARSPMISWLGWGAAAAAAAMMVYGLRRPVEPTAQGGAPLRQNPIELKDSSGKVLASLDLEAAASTTVLSVKRLPAAPSQRYQLWVSKEDGVIRPIGFFGCETECVDMTLRVHDSPRRGELRHVWLTRSETEAREFGVGTQTVAEAQ